MSIRIGASVVVLALASAGLNWPPSAFGQEQPGPDKTFHAEVDLVSTYFTVRDDKKHLVTDLPQDGFTVTEEGQSQAIKFFAHHSDVVLNVGVLLDTGTMMSRILGEEAEASKMFLRSVTNHLPANFDEISANLTATLGAGTQRVKTKVWNLTLQQVLGSGLALEIGYLGSVSRKIYDFKANGEEHSPFILGTTTRILNTQAGLQYPRRHRKLSCVVPSDHVF